MMSSGAIYGLPSVTAIKNVLAIKVSSVFCFICFEHSMKVGTYGTTGWWLCLTEAVQAERLWKTLAFDWCVRYVRTARWTVKTAWVPCSVDMLGNPGCLKGWCLIWTCFSVQFDSLSLKFQGSCHIHEALVRVLLRRLKTCEWGRSEEY